MENNFNKSAEFLNQDSAATQKPCIVQSTQGFSVSYKNKFLYSKYAPQKAIINTINSLSIQPQTLFLCISPVLPYGLKELSDKLPQNCFLLGCEADSNLLDLIDSNKNQYNNIKNFSLLTQNELLNLGPILTKQNYTLQSGITLPNPGTFRRIVRIDFSAGSQINDKLYHQIHQNSVDALMTFWANRITLVKFGRKYSANFFKNLSVLSKTLPITNYFNSIQKPIIVFGSGESTEDGINHLLNCKNQNIDISKSFFILCTDTAAQPLISNGIIPDGIFIEEAQKVIAKCFIGIQNKTHIFAGLSSLHSITHIFDLENISYFTTEYTNSNFLNFLEKKNILPPTNSPFGSVGLTTLYYAIKFRKDTSIPVYFYGLDFSYSCGKTHAKGTMAYNNRIISQNRLNSNANYESCFLSPAQKIIGKNNLTVYTTPVLNKYALLADNIFSDISNIYDSSLFGLKNNFEHKLPEPEAKIDTQKKDYIYYNLTDEKNLKDYLISEREELIYLKDILTGNKKIPENELQDFLSKTISDKEYLYLHFPDGHQFQYNQSFLNRVRVEIDYFLGIIK